MATFAVKDGNTADIDPESLTVNLLGPEPDPENLVITPQNVKMPDGEKIDDGPVDEQVSGSPADDESIDKILNAQKPVQEEKSTGNSDDEEEIKAIEDMLRSKKSARVKKQKAAVQPEGSPKDAGKHKIDPIVIVSGIVAAVLIFVFIAYFSGLFGGSNSLKMTLDQFSASYAKTDAYKAIAPYGFAFPEVTFDEETTASDATAAPKPSNVRSFTASLDNTVNYQIAVTGTVNKSDSNIKALRVFMLLSNSSAFNEVLVIFAPYIQVLYPDMSTTDATAFLSELYTSKEPVTVKGNYGVSLGTDSSSGYLIISLDIISSKDAKAYSASKTASAAAATETSTAADSTTASVSAAAAAETTAAS